MIEIKNLLSGIRNILLLKEDREKIILETVFKVTNLQIKKESLEIKNGVLYFKVKPIYKSEIFIKKDEILLSLKNSLGGRAPVEIR